MTEKKRHKTKAALSEPRGSFKNRRATSATITSGFAHNFNNLLTIISGNLQLIAVRSSDKKLNEPIEEAILACELGANMVQNLLTHTRQRRLDIRPYNVIEVIENIADVIKKVAGPNVDLSFPKNVKVPPVGIDKTEFSNAIINLCLNARDAMPDGGKLVFRIQRKRFKGALHQSRQHKDFVVLSVVDDGHGMLPTVKARACEPFFTTKAPNLGTGLGLATVSGFAEQIGGWIDIKSSVGNGTTVKLGLPVLEKQPSKG